MGNWTHLPMWANEDISCRFSTNYVFCLDFFREKFYENECHYIASSLKYAIELVSVQLEKKDDENGKYGHCQWIITFKEHLKIRSNDQMVFRS